MQEFNKGVYDYIIATDESNAHAEQDSEAEAEEAEQENVPESTEDCTCPTKVTLVMLLILIPSHIDTTRTCGGGRGIGNRRT